MKPFKFAALVAVIVTVCAPARAQWMYTGEESAFGGTGSHLAATMGGGYVFAFRCDDSGPVAVYLTPEIFENSDVKDVPPMATMLLRVDDLEVHKNFAVGESASQKLRFTATADRELLTQVMQAKRRVAVAMQAQGKMFHEQTFNVRGSTTALKRFLAGCPTLDADDQDVNEDDTGG